jgi:nucleoside-diphosphate-sugar epimerase
LPPISFSPIGNCKRAVEQLGFLYAKVSGISFVSLRVGRVYGPGASARHPIRTMVESAVKGVKADLSMLPQSTRMHPVYAGDVGEATRLIHDCRSLHHYIYNISDGSNPAMLEIAETVRDLIPNSEMILGPATAESAPYSEVDVQRMKQEFGFEFRSLRAGLEEYIRWVRMNRIED